MTTEDTDRHENEADVADHRQTAGATTFDWQFTGTDPLEVYDTDVEHRDTASNRDRYAPKPGWKFVATDTGKVYLGDGSSWNHMGHVVSLPDDVVGEERTGTDAIYV